MMSTRKLCIGSVTATVLALPAVAFGGSPYMPYSSYPCAATGYPVSPSTYYPSTYQPSSPLSSYYQRTVNTASRGYQYLVQNSAYRGLQVQPAYRGGYVQPAYRGGGIQTAYRGGGVQPAFRGGVVQPAYGFGWIQGAQNFGTVQPAYGTY